MNFISRRTHGILDYILGIVLILAPVILALGEGPESRVPVILGIATLAYSALTNYELGILRFIPFRVHLGLDAVSGLLLAASPWLFQFDDRVWVPHLVLGILEIGAVLFTRKVPGEHHTGTPV